MVGRRKHQVRRVLMFVGKPLSKEWIFSIYDRKNLKYRKIVVTGPQRSGTRFVGTVLSDSLGKLDWQRASNSSTEHYKLINNNIHALYKHPTIFHTPGQSHRIHTLPRCATGTRADTLVIWMDRNNEDVIESEDRIYPHIYPGNPKKEHYDIAGKPILSWHERCFEREEKPKYLEMFPEHEEKIKSFDRNVHMKKWVWENIQRDKMEVDFVEIKYESLKDLDEFVPKEKRKDWTLKQVRESGRNAYNPNY